MVGGMFSNHNSPTDNKNTAEPSYRKVTEGFLKNIREKEREQLKCEKRADTMVIDLKNEMR